MKNPRPVVLGLLLLAVVLAVHHDAWRGYFEDDDLNNLTWARLVNAGSMAADIFKVRFPLEPGRPVGNLFYAVMVRISDMRFPLWAVVLQCIGLLNLALLWRLLRRLETPAWAAALGCLAWACNRALFDGWWKPMFIFDVFCTTFALACLVAYLDKRWIVSFVMYWLALRSKEIALGIPVALLVYEMSLGERKWQRTLPFFMPALAFGLGGLWFNRKTEGAYHMTFTAAGLWRTVAFYGSRMCWLLPALFVRDRRIYFGFSLFACTLFLYLFLPDRLLDVYLYLPLTGLALVVAVLASKWPRPIAALVLVWVAWQCVLIRRHAQETLLAASERRDFAESAKNVQDAQIYVYDQTPESLHYYGVDGALRASHPKMSGTRAIDSGLFPDDQTLTLLGWDASHRRVWWEPFSPGSYTRVERNREPENWQMVHAWQRDHAINKLATIRLYRMAGANRFYWEACGESGAELRTFINGEELDQIRFSAAGCTSKTAILHQDGQGILTADFLVHPEAKRVTLGAFGFHSSFAQ